MRRLLPAGFFRGLGAGAGRLCGISLASLVLAGVRPHHADLRLPEVKGTGIGHELLRQSLMGLRDAGCRSASLTVTAANEEAVALYERVGFRTVRQFPAYVWEGL